MAWAIDLGVQITDVGRSLYIWSFCPAMTSLSRYLEEAAFSISISSSVFYYCNKNERPTGKKHTTVRWDEGGEIGKLIT